MARRRKIQQVSNEEIIDAIQASNGTIRLAATALEVSEVSLYKKILATPALLSFLLPERASAELDTESRHPDAGPAPCPLDILDPDLPADGQAVLRNDTQLLVSGLRNAGIKAGTMDKLEAMGAFNPATGAIIGHSLRTMHQMLVYGNVALFEEAEFIRTKYLSTEEANDISDGERAEWYAVYIAIWNVLGKGYDRTMKGTVALVEMMSAAKPKDDETPTPGFKPLK
jgi:hypothetical protein